MKTYDELTNDIIEKTKNEKTRRRKLKRRICAGMTSFALILSTLLAVHLVNRKPELPILEPSRTTSVNQEADKTGQILSAKNNYNAIFDRLDTENWYDDSNEYSGIKGIPINGIPEASKPIQDAEIRGPVSNDSAADETDHSETNIQVDGVLEADVFKTDGEYVYAVSHKNIYIYSAKEGQMEPVSQIPYLNDDGSLITKNTDGDAKLYLSYRTPELYIAEGRLILIVQAAETDNSYGIDEGTNDMYMYDRICCAGHEYICTMIYDTSTPASPTLLSSNAVSGSAISSRLIGERLYLVCDDSYLYAPKPEKNEPETYIPKCIINGRKYLVSEKSVFCGDEMSLCEYLNILEVNVTSGEVSSSLSLLGYSGDIMYQSHDSIYVARSGSRDKIENTNTAAGVKTEQHSNTSVTTLTKISVSDGLALAGSAELEGYFESSFSMDDYNGHLRAVMSVRKYFDTRIIRKDANGDEYEEYAYIDTDNNTEMSNSVYVLDSSMTVVGSLTGLAPDERVYSCRFDGNDAYFVTYRETDPLFHIDLSDVTAPKVISELKIPGFSEHLQRFGDMLFGFGETDEGELKLSMFCENEDGSMTELATQTVKDAFYSEALDDHHALIVDYEKNLICFSANTEDLATGYGSLVYYVYSFVNGQFSRRADISLCCEGYSSGSVRGLYIGNFFYIYQNDSVQSALMSYDMTNFGQIDEEIMDTAPQTKN